PPIRQTPAEQALLISLQLEAFRPQTGLLQAALELRKRRLGDVDRPLLLCLRVDGDEALGRLSLQPNDLPLRCEAAWQTVERGVVDAECAQLLVVFIGTLELALTPGRGEPVRRDDKQNCFTTGCRIGKSALPFLAGGYSPLRIEIEKDIVRLAPAFGNQPVAQSDRPIVVAAGMADEKSRHYPPDRVTAAKNCMAILPKIEEISLVELRGAALRALIVSRDLSVGFPAVDGSVLPHRKTCGVSSTSFWVTA